MPMETRNLLENLSNELKSQDIGDGREERHLYNLIDYMIKNSLYPVIPSVIVNLLQSIYEQYKTHHVDFELRQLTEIFELILVGANKKLYEGFDINKVISLYEKDIYFLMRNGQELGKITVCAQDYSMITHQIGAELFTGDVLIKKLPYGENKKYRITKIEKIEDEFAFPAYYKLQFQMEDKMSVNNISISNNSAPINVNSTNTNSFNINEGEIFEKMLAKAESLNDSNIIQAIKDMQVNCQDKKMFKEKYERFKAIAADYLGVFKPFIEEITRLFL